MPNSAVDFLNQVGSTREDVERLYAFLLERNAPASSRDLALHLIEWHSRAEEKRIAQAAERAALIYQPKQTYTVSQRIQFPAFGNREGVVKKIRAGDNPRFGAFQVIAIKFDDGPQLHEFAASFARPHPLNQDQAEPRDALSQEQIIAQYGVAIRTRVVESLSADKEFVHSGDQWFLRELIPEINPGYLNLAEAAIEQSGDAIRASALLKILDMPDSAKNIATMFSLSRALSNDQRFDDVGGANESRWFLTRLEPPEALEYPPVLQAAPAQTAPLAPELETIAAELYDEADPSTSSGQALNGNAQTVAAPRDEITLVLTYPHRRAGTLPLTPTLRALLPEISCARLKFAFEDASAHTGPEARAVPKRKKFAGFAVKEGNYIAGLSQRFNAWRLSPGAMITLKRGADPLTLIIDPQLQRERGLWVRVARVIGGRLTFAQERRPVANKYDEEMLILVGDPIGLDKLTESPQARMPLTALLEEIFPELAKLSIAGSVHAKTLYSAVNFVRRAGPRAVLSALSESRALSSAGGGYFVLNEAKR